MFCSVGAKPICLFRKDKMGEKTGLPRHVAVIMDGNGRWAKGRGLPRLAGHNAGMIAMKEMIKKACEMGILHLTVYAFSTENWKRTEEEVKGIFKLLVFYVDKELRELHKNGVKVRVLGDIESLPKEAVQRIVKAVETTKDNGGMQFNIALNYGGRAEIIGAARRISMRVADGEMAAEDITEATMSAELFTGRAFAHVPDPELIIRTGGEERLSNFLLWQSAYSELIFMDILWPDFKPEDFERAIEEYGKRERRFGGR